MLKKTADSHHYDNEFVHAQFDFQHKGRASKQTNLCPGNSGTIVAVDTL